MDHQVDFLVLLLTERCNLSCAYCYTRSTREGKDMDEETAFLAIDRFASRNSDQFGKPVVVELAGGEPLLNFSLVKSIITYGQTISPNIRFAVQTNATLLNDTIIDFLSDHNIGLGLSLDGIPEVNNTVRGKSNAVVKALKRLDERGMGTNITTVLTKSNIDRFPEFLLFCGLFSSVKTINLDIVRPLGRAAEVQQAPQKEQISEMMNQTIHTLNCLNLKRCSPIRIRELEQIKRYYPFSRQCVHRTVLPYCFAAKGSSVAVAPDGSLYACASLINRVEFCAAHIKNPDIGMLQALVPLPGQVPLKCMRCRIYPVCRGGCPSRKIAYNGDLFSICNIECHLRKEIVSGISKMEYL